MTHVDKIKLFLEGKLSASEQKAFTEEISNNPELREEVEDYRKIFSGLEGLREEAFEKKIQEWTAALPEPKKEAAKIFRLSTNFRKVASGALVLVVSAIILWAVIPQGNDLSVYAAENYIAPKLDTYKGENNDIKSFRKSKEHFLKKDFKASKAEAEKIDANDSLHLMAQFIIGHSNYQIKEFQEAEKIFLNIEKIKGLKNYMTIDFNPDNSTWTLILSQLQLYIQKKREKKVLLQTIESFIENTKKTDYKAKAEKLMAKLK